MNFGLPISPSQYTGIQPRFGAWEAALNSQPLLQLVNEIEDTLELPLEPVPVPGQPVVLPLAQYPEAHRPSIQALQETLKKVEPNNGYGMRDAIGALRTLAVTGYQLTKEELEKFKLLVRKDTYGLNSAITNFPAANQFSRQADFTMTDIEAFLPHWLKEQTYYQPIEELVKTMDRSPKFLATANIQTMIANRLKELKQDLQDAEVRAALLKRLGNSFRPKAALASDIQTVMKAALGQNGPVSAKDQAKIDQAIQLIAKRNTRISFAGRTATGEIYIFTRNTNNYEEAFFWGQPGAMKTCLMTGGIRARDGSDTHYTLENDQKFNFKRGGLGEGDDLTQWRATLNDVPIPYEFPTPTLEPKRF